MMERLTGYENITEHCHNIPLVDLQLVFDRLAAYEDTGLTPERCVELSRELERANKQLKAADECIARCQEALDDLAEADSD